MHTFKEFRNVVIKSANQSWTRVGRKMMWTHQPGDIVFLLIFTNKPRTSYFEEWLRYAPKEWTGDNIISAQCGALASPRRMVRKTDLNLVADYPGTDENFYAFFFDSMHGSDLSSVRTREDFPDMLDLELRAADLTQYFKLLRDRLEPLKTLQDIQESFEGNLDQEFWASIKPRVENCDTSAPPSLTPKVLPSPTI